MSVRCKATHPEVGGRCGLVVGHEGDHFTYVAGLGRAEWPQHSPAELAAMAEEATTLDELLEHLKDLAALAEHEGFLFFARTLRRYDELIRGARAVYEPTPQERAAWRAQLQAR